MSAFTDFKEDVYIVQLLLLLPTFLFRFFFFFFGVNFYGKIFTLREKMWLWQHDNI